MSVFWNKIYVWNKLTVNANEICRTELIKGEYEALLIMVIVENEITITEISDTINNKNEFLIRFISSS